MENYSGVKRRRLFGSEDDKMLEHIVKDSEFNGWKGVAKLMPGFSAKQLRDRWHNYISPNNTFGPWTLEEDRFIVQNVKKFGTKWSLIASYLKGRSDNCVKNRWNTVLKEDQMVHPEKYYTTRKQERNQKWHPPQTQEKPVQMEQLYLDARFVEHFFVPATKSEIEFWKKVSIKQI